MDKDIRREIRQHKREEAKLKHMKEKYPYYEQMNAYKHISNQKGWHSNPCAEIPLPMTQQEPVHMTLHIKGLETHNEELYLLLA